MMRLGGCVLAGLVLIGGAASAETGDSLIVTGDGVNVRTEPTTESDILTRLYRDQEVVEVERQGDWVRAEIAGTDGEEGWIHGSLLAPPGGDEAAAAEREAEAGETAAPTEIAVTPAEDGGDASAAMPEPAAGPEAAELVGVERFREAVTYLNGRAQEVAGVDLFTGVESAGGGTVRVVATDAWSTVPPAGRRSYLNTLFDRWSAARDGEEPVRVQIVDDGGDVVMERSEP